ncbi:ankyrin repeat-containing domain protein [Xylaria grammica]|nr:ankyrin repeat-containing domain protein [Xylaria grammica]
MALPVPSRIPEGEWDHHKETIIARYLGDDQTQGLTLNELAEAMRSDHGFSATESQYESRLKAWVARKNLARKEWKLVFEMLDSLPQAMESRVVISGRVIDKNKISRARRKYDEQSMVIENPSALSYSSVSTLPQHVRIEIQGLDGEWVQLPEMAATSTGRTPDPSVADLSREAPTTGNTMARNDDEAAHENASSNIPTGDRRETIEGLVFRAIPPVSRNTVINVATDPDVDLDQSMPLEQTNEGIDMGFLETPNISGFNIDNLDPISLPDVSIMPPECNGISWGPSSAFDNELVPINSFLLDSAPRAPMDPLWLPSGQYLPPRPMSASVGTGMEWTRHSYSLLIASSGRLVGPHSPTLMPQTDSWLPPSAAIAAMVVKDIYANAQNTSPFRTALSAATLKYSFLFDMNSPVSIKARARVNIHYSPSLNNLLSIETFFGEGFTEPPNNVAMRFSAEAHLYSRLITSVVNGFAGVENIPAAGILRSLSRHPTTRMSMDQFLRLGQSPVHKSLAENIFQAALKDDNVDVVRYLLNSSLVQVNPIEGYDRGSRYTVLERAAGAESFGVLRFLVTRSVDINKPFDAIDLGDALESLIYSVDGKSTLDDDFLSLVEVFLIAGAVISKDSIETALEYVDQRLAIRLIEKSASQSPQDLLLEDDMLLNIIKYLDKADSTRLAILIIENCRKSGINWPRDQYPSDVTKALHQAAGRGYEELVEAFCDKETTDFASLMNALISRNKGRLLMLEEKGVLRHLRPNQLRRAFIVALEAGNLSFANRILDIDPELHFMMRYSVEEDSGAVSALAAALAYDFDDIAWKVLAVLIKKLHNQSNLDSLVAIIIKERKRDFARAMIESSSTIFELISQSTWESVMEWDDDLIINDFFRRAGVSPSALKVAVDRGRMDLFWCILESFPKGHPGWAEAGKLAIEYENLPLLEELLAHGTEPDDEELLYIALLRHPSMARPILEQYQKLCPQGRAEYGREAMEWIINYYPESSKFLDMFFEFGLVNEEILQGKPPVQKPLLFHAIQPEEIPYPEKFSKREQFSSVPLRPPQPCLIKRLLDFGCNSNMTMLLRYPFGETTTALLEAIETENVEIIQLLIQSGAEVNKPVGHGIRWTPLQKAAKLNNVEIVRLLLENGADANAPPPKLAGATALQFAAIQGNCHILMILIQHGARLDVPPPVGPYGRWPLEGAAENGRIDMIKLLWDINNGPFDEAQCKRAIRLAECNGHMGCRDMINELMGGSFIEYGA